MNELDSKQRTRRREGKGRYTKKERRKELMEEIYNDELNLNSAEVLDFDEVAPLYSDHDIVPEHEEE